MKCHLLLVFIFLSGLAIGIGFSRLASGQNTLTQNPQNAPVAKNDQAQIIFPADITNDYTLVKAQTVSFGENKEEFLIAGFVPVDYIPEKTDSPKSFLAVYKKTEEGFSPVYKFSPLFPEDIKQTRISFEDMWEIKTAVKGDMAIVTTWSQTGANYFGKYPIAIAYQNNTFSTVPFYAENLSEDPKLKNITWTNKDVTFKNRYE